MHLRWHAAAPFGVLLVDQAQATGYAAVNASNSWATVIDLSSFLMLLAGSLFPDVGNIGYKIGAWGYNKDIPLLRQTRWDGKTTRMFAALEKVSSWPLLYISLHSVLGLLVVSGIIAWVTVPELATWFAIGYSLHLAMDYPTHSTCYLWWPYRITRSRDQRWNWWHKKVKKRTP